MGDKARDMMKNIKRLGVLSYFNSFPLPSISANQHLGCLARESRKDSLVEAKVANTNRLQISRIR